MLRHTDDSSQLDSKSRRKQQDERRMRFAAPSKAIPSSVSCMPS